MIAVHMPSVLQPATNADTAALLAVLMLLPAQLEEGKAHLAIGFGCTGGQHRYVAVAEKLAKVLAEAGWQVSKRHRELERRVAPMVTDGNGVVRA